MVTTIKAIGTEAADKPLKIIEIPRRDLGPDDVLIDIKFAGICHSDIHTVRDEWAGTIYPVVPGHEIAGLVEAVGADVTKFSVGDRVGVGCYVDSCRECSNCEAGFEQYCLNGMTETYNGLDRRHNNDPTYGGYSTKIVVDQKYVLSIPEGIDLSEAAPLLCAGITMFSPLNRFKVGKGTKIAIVGLGGLGHMGVKIAAALGAEVTVLSQSLKKMEDGLRLGAHHYYATSDPDTFTAHASEFDLILNTVSAKIDLDAYLSLLKYNGTFVEIGVPEEPLSFNAFSLLAASRSIYGSLIGGIPETQQMLDFCGQHNIGAEVEVISADQVNEAYERTIASDVRYRFVIDTATIK